MAYVFYSNMMRFLNKLKYRKLILISVDIFVSAAIAVVFFFAWQNLISKLLGVAILLACVYLVRFAGRVYRQVWRYSTSREYLRIVLADFFGGSLYIVINYFLPTEFKIDPWLALPTVSVGCLAALSARYLYHMIYRKISSNQVEQGNEQNSTPEKIKVAIVGAGWNGVYLVREMRENSHSPYQPVCYVDTDKEKIGNVLSGLNIYDEEKSVSVLKNLGVQEVIISIQNISSQRRKEILDLYSREGLKVKIYEFPFMEGSEENAVREYDTTKKPVIRDFKVEDLLFRDPIKINSKKTANYYNSKVILITGGGGSIGSEICRQLAKFGPKKLIIFDIYENNAYDIQQELRNKYGDELDVSVEISSVREARRVDEVVAEYRPDVVVHAAAHKHVPLMEHNCAEAVKNNVFGTYNVVNAAEKYGVKKFIMISTDKAVNPTNVMGATKRMCEMIVQSRQNGSISHTEFTAVRFGNVLGSNGSVIPLFKRQIAAGGPITITDFRIIRYFMTIPEAAQLVLEAGSMAKNGELFVLDMGRPVKILNLAEDMIRLSGFEPYKDIDIKEVGLRPGEKLYEELLVKTEELDKTENDMIFIERDKALSREEVEAKLDILRSAVEDGSAAAVKSAVRQTVPTYHDPSEVNKDAEKSEEMQATAVLHNT